MDNFIDRGSDKYLLIAYQAATDYRALPQLMIANFSNGYGKPVAHLFHYAFKYPPLFLEGKGIIYNQPDLTDTDHHG
jgi:hypothetical protein